jgi:hypothetical protein
VRSLKAFLLGTVAVGISAYAVAAALAVSAQAAGRTLDLGLGPLEIVSVTTHGATTAITFGPALLALALTGGLLNLSAASVIRRRRAERRTDRVD